MKLKAVFLDMGGTIDTHTYDRREGIRATARVRKLLARVGIETPLSDDELYDLVTRGQVAYREWREKSLIELPPEKVWREFVLKDETPRPGQLDPVAEDLAYTVDTRYYQRSMRPEIPAVLEALKEMGLRLGIISNIQSHGQVPDDLDRYGIKSYFDPIVLSCEYRRRKPDPAIFHHAAELCGLPPGSCAHIGDRITRDILGARQAGFGVVVQIRHSFEEYTEPAEPKPDAVLESMEELPELIKAYCRLSDGL
jgi:putative hydrolase of the HAD superfamily